MVADELAERGWARFDADPALLRWAAAALPAARQALARPGGDWRCGGTWFVGVDALDNDATGAVAGVPLTGPALTAVAQIFGPQRWHRAQVSVVRPGYPQPDEGETPAASHYRLTRDGAHVDGLLPVGPDRRRMIREPHAFVLGLPLNACDPGASPLAVWEGSHRIMGAAFAEAAAGHAAADLPDVDVTAAYQAARRRVFAECARLLVPLDPGMAILLHRHLLHGVSPWAKGAIAPPEGRIIAYFRPLAASVSAWL